MPGGEIITSKKDLSCGSWSLGAHESSCHYSNCYTDFTVTIGPYGQVKRVSRKPFWLWILSIGEVPSSKIDPAWTLEVIAIVQKTCVPSSNTYLALGSGRVYFSRGPRECKLVLGRWLDSQILNWNHITPQCSGGRKNFLLRSSSWW